MDGIARKSRIIFGMSGTLKGTTIKKMYSDSPDHFILWSDTKLFFEADRNLFSWQARLLGPSIATSRLIYLQRYIPREKLIVCERGVTDFLFPLPTYKLSGLESYDKMDIPEITRRENEYIRSNGYDIVRTLLVMKDRNFIMNNVLKGSDSTHRVSLYPEVDSYLSSQDEYVEFTCKYNKIDEIIEITDAWDYISKL